MDLHLLAATVEADCREAFARIDAVAAKNTEKVLDAFREERVALADFTATTGYGYDDVGRDKLDRIYARTFGAEAALVRLHFFNGTHTIATALYGILRPGDTLLSAVDAPYDTLADVISGRDGEGSLAEWGVSYAEQAFLPDFEEYISALSKTVSELLPKAVIIQRSRGYSQRRTLTVAEIGRICNTIKAVSPETVTIVDNCYGEFCEESEPCACGADLMCGSLIKNPGGGMAPAGGYIAGKEKYVRLCAARLSVPGIGAEVGANPAGYRDLYQGFFMAPHITAQAVKTAVFAARLLELMGFDSAPAYDTPRSDIIQTITFGAPEPLIAFCRGIQEGSPVDSFAAPEPWAMPGYADPVIMAAGAFVQGASIELSADGPIRAPYTVYMQGGLTYEAGKIGILSAAKYIAKEN